MHGVTRKADDVSGVEDLFSYFGEGCGVLLSLLPKRVFFLSADHGDDAPSGMVVNCRLGAGCPSDHLNRERILVLTVEKVDRPARLLAGRCIFHLQPVRANQQLAYSGHKCLDPLGIIRFTCQDVFHFSKEAVHSVGLRGRFGLD